MTVVVLVADVPHPGVLPDLVATTPIDGTAAVALYRAALADTVRAVADSGGDLLVNYPAPDDAPVDDPERRLRALVAEALEDRDADPRFEVRAGSSFTAHVGNAVTHLLRDEDVTSAAALRPDVPLVDRTLIDEAAMKLRRSPVVLAPAEGGRIAYAGFAEPIDFTGAYTPPAVETTVDRAGDAGHEADFVEQVPTIRSASGVATTVATVRARDRAGLRVPADTIDAIEDLGLRVTERDGEPTIESRRRPDEESR